MTAGRRGIAGAAVAVVALVAPAAAAAGDSAAQAPLLSVGHPVVGGNYSAGCDDPTVLFPMLMMSHSTRLVLAQASTVTLSITPAAQSVHPTTTPTGLALSTRAANGAFTPVKDASGKAIEAGANTQGVPGYPQTSSVTAQLDPGIYYTSVLYGYCHGFFAVTLDAAVPVEVPAAKTGKVAAKVPAVITAKIGKVAVKAKAGAAAPKAKAAKVKAAKRAKVTVTVTAAGVAKPTGKVTLTVVKQGKKHKTVSGTLAQSSQGKLVLRLPKLKVGKYTVKVAYGGSAAVTSRTVKAFKLTAR
jgi:hypothetical protein